MSKIDQDRTQNIYNQQSSVLKPPKIKQSVRIQYINQNLQEAVKQLKRSIHSNPNQSNLKSSSKFLGKNQPKISKIQNPQINVTKIMFTQTFQKHFEKKLSQIKIKSKQLRVRSLSKQQNAIIERKRKQIIEIEQKKQLIQYLQQKKLQSVRQIQLRKNRRNQEKKFLHDTSMDKVSMLRKSRIRDHKKQLDSSRVEQQQSLANSKFRYSLQRKSNDQRHKLMKTKYDFLIKKKSNQQMMRKTTSFSQRYARIKSKSRQSLRRNIKTSQFPRRNEEK